MKWGREQKFVSRRSWGGGRWGQMGGYGEEKGEGKRKYDGNEEDES